MVFGEWVDGYERVGVCVVRGIGKGGVWECGCVECGELDDCGEV